MADTLPNCLGRVPRADHNMPGYWKVFCANCGALTFYAQMTELPAEYAFSLCNDCVEKYGEPAGFTKTPDDVFWGKCRDAMMEDYGKILTNDEIAIELELPSSPISLLEREAQRR
jgi:hypothetical protein